MNKINEQSNHKFTIDNYFENSKGDFKFLMNINANEYFLSKDILNRNVIKPNDELINILSKLLKIKDIENLKVSYLSKLNHYDYTITSMYFVYKDNIIRISEHWSEFKDYHNNVYENNKYKNVGTIRSCWWNLKFSKNDLNKFKNKLFKNKYFIGIINLKDFKEHFNPFFHY